MCLARLCKVSEDNVIVIEIEKSVDSDVEFVTLIQKYGRADKLS